MRQRDAREPESQGANQNKVFWQLLTWAMLETVYYRQHLFYMLPSYSMFLYVPIHIAACSLCLFKELSFDWPSPWPNSYS